MDKRKRTPRWCVVAIVALLPSAMLASGCGTGPDSAIVETPSVVQRLLPVVWAGSESAGTIPKLEDDAEQPLPAGSLVRTGATGEAMLKIGSCHPIYLFFDSAIIKAACPNSDYVGGNVTCTLSGTSIHNNSCSGQVLLQTMSATIVLEGTWVQVTYVEELQLTIVVVAEGEAEVWPVTHLEDRVLGQPVELPAQHFLFTAPDDLSREITQRPPRVSHPLRELPPVVDQLYLGTYIDSVRRQADRDQVEFPWPARIDTPTPTLTALPTPAHTPARASTRPPTDTPRPKRGTPSPTPSATLLPQDTPTATATSTATPTPETVEPLTQYRLAWVSDRTGSPQIWVMNGGNGSDKQQLTFQGENIQPTWAPDDRKIAFASNRDGFWVIYVMAADGSDQKWAYGSDQYGRPATSPSYSSKERLAYLADSDGSWEIYVDGERLTYNDTTELGLAWSPDGGQIVFEGRPDSGYRGLYVVDVNSGEEWRLSSTDYESWNVAWSPDGDEVVAATLAEGYARVARIDLAYSNLVPIGPEGRWSQLPGWSPSGQWISYVMGEEGDWGLYVATLDGVDRARRFFPLGRSDYGEPYSWSPDGSRIALVAAGGDGDYEIFTLSIGTDERRQLTANKGEDTAPAWSWGPVR